MKLNKLTLLSLPLCAIMLNAASISKENNVSYDDIKCDAHKSAKLLNSAEMGKLDPLVKLSKFVKQYPTLKSNSANVVHTPDNKSVTIYLPSDMKIVGIYNILSGQSLLNYQRIDDNALIVGYDGNKIYNSARDYSESLDIVLIKKNITNKPFIIDNKIKRTLFNDDSEGKKTYPSKDAIETKKFIYKFNIERQPTLKEDEVIPADYFDYSQIYDYRK